MSFEYIEITDPFYLENCQQNNEEDFLLVRAKDVENVPIKLPNWQPPAHCYTTRFSKHEHELLNFEVKPDDVWVASYPKSGTTWCQEMVWLICNDLNFTAARAETLRTRFPFLDISLIHDVQWNTFHRVRDTPSPRFVMTHLPVSMLPKQYWEVKPKTVHIRRNPKSVAVSFYHHSRNIFYRGTKENFIRSFMKDLHFYSPYHTHVIEYHELRDCDNILHLCYEDMKRDLKSVVQQVCKFFGKSYSDERLDQLYEHLSFESMQDNQACNYDDGDKLRQFRETRFIRKGESDGWKRELPEDLIDEMDRWTAERVTNDRHRSLF